jgi:outer membrane lipoprotein-sorting protein
MKPRNFADQLFLNWLAILSVCVSASGCRRSVVIMPQQVDSISYTQQGVVETGSERQEGTSKVWEKPGKVRVELSDGEIVIRNGDTKYS